MSLNKRSFRMLKIHSESWTIVANSIPIRKYKGSAEWEYFDLFTMSFINIKIFNAIETKRTLNKKEGEERNMCS